MAALVAVALGGCEKKPKKVPGPTGPASTAELDALWALAPEGANVGWVMTASALARMEAGALEVNKLFAVAPELAPLKTQIDVVLQEALGTTNPTLASIGLTSTKGAALFAIDGDVIAVLPVGDRDKFLGLLKGTKGPDGDTIKRTTCKTVKNVYACAENVALFDKLGNGTVPDAVKLAGARGDIEFIGTFPDKRPVVYGGVVQLGRGSFVMRAGIEHLPADVMKYLVNAKPRVDDKQAGFALLNVEPFVGVLTDELPEVPIVEGATARALARSIKGPLTATIEHGAAMFDVRLPLTDGGPMKKLLEQCDKIPSAAAVVGAKVKDGVCSVKLAELGMDIDAWVDGSTLRIGKKAASPAATSVAMSPIAQELAKGDWAVSMFGRGTMYGPVPMPMPMPVDQLPPEVLMGVRGVAMLNEIGFGVRVDGDVVRILLGVRTAWANPDDVIAKLVAVPVTKIMGGQDTGKAIAQAAPQSPFAGDHASGYGGLMISAGVVGIVAAIAIPAFLDYTKKTKVSEAQLQLNKIGKSAKAAFIADAEFPKGNVGPTPAKSCCETGGACQPDPATWSDPVWQSLEFMITEPHLYRYSYASDGKTFTATAHGDLDCDQREAVWTITGTSDGHTVVVQPQPGED